MIVEISTPVHGKLELKPSLPAAYRGVVLPGGQAYALDERHGLAVLQEWSTAQFTLGYYVFRFAERTSIQAREQAFPFQSLAALRQPVTIHLNGSLKLTLREHQQAFVFDPAGDRRFLFEKDREYHLFAASFSEDLTRQFLSLFPDLQSALSPPGSRQLILRPAFMEAPVMDLIQELLHSPFDGALRLLYFENKSREYLFLLLARSRSPPEVPTRLLPAEIEAVHQARQLILGDIERHHTIGELARLVQLNEFKLKAGFRHLFGAGMFEFLLEARMRMARQLLLDTPQPIKQIAARTGYRRVTSFITAFRRHFGYTPGSLRKK